MDFNKATRQVKGMAGGAKDYTAEAGTREHRDGRKREGRVVVGD
jgi:hypothetical protein